MDKPPLGLRPKYVVDGLRVVEILEAIHRYNSVGKSVPRYWIKELEDLCVEKENDSGKAG